MKEHRFGFSRKLPPLKCPDCDRRLGPVLHGKIFDKDWKEISPKGIESYWRGCSCGCYIAWSFPNVWKRRHRLPLFDDRLIIQEAP